MEIPCSQERTELREEDVIRDIRVLGKEETHGKEVFIYRPRIFPDVKGILFPNDNVISVGEYYDVIVNRITKNNQGKIVTSEVYYEDTKLLNNPLIVRISKISTKNQPMFRLRGYPANYTGFVIDCQANEGDIVVVRTKIIKPMRELEKIIEASIISRVG